MLSSDLRKHVWHNHAQLSLVCTSVSGLLSRHDHLYYTLDA